MTADTAAPADPRRRRLVTPWAYRVCPAGLETADRPAWLALRREGLGGSDIAAVLGLDVDPKTGRPRRTAWQVYLDKTGALGDDDELTERQEELIWFGHAMEPVAARRFRMLNPGVRLARMGMLARADAPWMRVNVDRRVYGCPDGPCGWEGKNRNAYTARDWDAGGDPDKVPDAPAAQCHWAMIVTGWTHWHLTAVIGGNELRTYRIDANPALHRTMVAEASWFWHDCVLAGVAPPVDASERTGRILARLWDVAEGAVKDAGPDQLAAVARLRAAAAQENRYAQEADALRHELQAWLGEAEIALDPATGKPAFTWKQNSSFRESAFRDEQPDAWATYARTVRVTDTALLNDKDPDLFRAYRARQFRLSAAPKEND